LTTLREAVKQHEDVRQTISDLKGTTHEHSFFSSNPLDSLEKGINQVMGAVFEEALREAVGQGS
jgi:hypothetical protein